MARASACPGRCGNGALAVATFLVTGGAGYIGSHTVKALAQAGHTCLTYDNLSTGHRDFVRWGPLIEGDIRDAGTLESVFAAHAIDAVVHFAAVAYVGESVRDPGRYYDININGTRTLLDVMVRARVGRMVFSSSCAVYAARGDAPLTERDAVGPVNPYGFSKLVCEQMLADYETAHGLRSIRLRYFNAAGADPDGEIGEHHDPETHLIPLVLDAAAGRRDAIAVFGSDYATRDGTAVRDYVHVSDLAAAHVTAAEHLVAGADSALFNLGTGTGASVREVIDAARRVTGRRIGSVDAARRPGDHPVLVAGAEQARQDLSWRPQRSDLETVLRDAWAWSQSRFGDAPNAGAKP